MNVTIKLFNTASITINPSKTLCCHLRVFSMRTKIKCCRLPPHSPYIRMKRSTSLWSGPTPLLPSVLSCNVSTSVSVKMEPSSPKKIQFAVPPLQGQLDPQAAENVSVSALLSCESSFSFQAEGSVLVPVVFLYHKVCKSSQASDNICTDT